MAKKGFVYIVTTRNNTVLYTGVTSDLKSRIVNHKTRKYKGSFTARFNVDKLVYYEELKDMDEAYKREKQIKAGSRKKKTELINSLNPEWTDLFDTL